MLQLNGYRARIAGSEADLRASQVLRTEAFFQNTSASKNASEVIDIDSDEFDPACRHVLVEDQKTGELCCCLRFMHLADGSEIHRTYSSQYYDLSNIGHLDGPLVEVGRFCVNPKFTDPNILRTALGYLTHYVDKHDVKLLMGCSSFQGIDKSAYLDAFALLKESHLAPPELRPLVKAPEIFAFADKLNGYQANLARAGVTMPALLRSYLALGGWVSDHAVIDRNLNTLHVFTGLDVSAIPATRARLLRDTIRNSI